MVIEGQGLLIGGKLWGKRAVVGEKKAFKLTASKNSYHDYSISVDGHETSQRYINSTQGRVVTPWHN